MKETSGKRAGLGKTWRCKSVITGLVAPGMYTASNGIQWAFTTAINVVLMRAIEAYKPGSNKCKSLVYP